MNGYPIPTCILNRLRARQYEVYDGRHRFETAYRYANDRFDWNGKKFSELSSEEKERFLNRELPVTIMIGATPNQLADVFIRLNKGVPLKDYDLFWAMRASPLVSATERLVFPHTRLSNSLGGVNLSLRTDLANWVGLVIGLNTRNAGNISTSHIRASEIGGIHAEVDDAYVLSGLDALATLYETANERYPATNKVKGKFKQVGRISAFFLAEWIPAENKYDVIDKWVSIIGRLRGPNASSMAMALASAGPQNLTAERITRVLEQVRTYLADGVVPGGDLLDTDDDEE
jgi:hypothetical protein